MSDFTVRFACPKKNALIPVATEVHYLNEMYEPIHLISSNELDIRIPNAEKVEAIVVRPDAMNWTTIVLKPQDGAIYACPAIELEDLQNWRSACGVSSGHSAKGLRVGIIDIGFANRSGFESIEFLTDRTDDVLPLESHGANVSRIIGSKDGEPISGICSDIDLVFFDAGFNEPGGADAGKLETEAVVDAIYFLAEQKDCLIINISAGLPSPIRSRALENAIDAAKQSGTICIAASGNNPSEKVRSPAAYDDVVGVGGIGVCSIAPEGTFAKFVEEVAQGNGLLSKKLQG